MPNPDLIHGTELFPYSAKVRLEILKDLLTAQEQSEEAVQQRIAQHLEAAGCKVRELAYCPADIPLVEEFSSPSVRDDRQRKVVMGELPGRPDMPAILMFAHPDCEHLDNSIERWTRRPFAGEVVDGHLFGWGVADDLAGCAAGLSVILEMAEQPVDRGNVVFASTPSKRHAHGVSALLHDGFRTDAALYLHPAESGNGLKDVKSVTPGQLEFMIRIAGRPPDSTEPSHAAVSHKAENPIERLFLICSALRELADGWTKTMRHPLLEAQAGRAANLQFSRLSTAEDHSLSRVPNSCRIGGAVSFPPGQDIRALIDEFETCLDRVCRVHGWSSRDSATVEWISAAAPAETPQDHPLYRVASDAIFRVTGTEPIPNALHVASDIRNPVIQAGIPCVGLGCEAGDLSQNGAVDEWIGVASYHDMIAAATMIAKGWSSGSMGAARLLAAKRSNK